MAKTVNPNKNIIYEEKKQEIVWFGGTLPPPCLVRTKLFPIIFNEGFP
jgi:hypothetical protein